MPRLHAGVAKSDITPSAGTQVAGSVGARRFAQAVLDPLYVRATVFQLGTRRLCLVVLDNTIITLGVTQRIRDGAKSLGFAPQDVMVQATQTHTAPGLGHFMGDDELLANIPAELEFIKGGDSAYDDMVIPRAVDAIRRAAENLKPVKIALGSAYEENLSFNRRGIQKDGSCCMPWHNYHDRPLGPTNVVYTEGPIDPEIGVLALRTDDTRIASILLNFTCHPVNVYPQNVISADWCGAACDALDRSLGGTSTVVNGCCGDINPWPFYDPAFKCDHLRMGQALARRATEVVERMIFEDADVLDSRLENIQLNVREIEPAKLAEAHAYLEKHPLPERTPDGSSVTVQWMIAMGIASVECLRKRDPKFPYEVQAFRIGNAAIVGLPGEPFAIGGMQVKMASPAALTLVAHLTTQYVGYLPPRDAYKSGGHEAAPSFWSKLAPGSLETVVEEASRITRSLFA